MALKGLYHVLHPPVPSRRIVHGRGIRGLIQPRLADTHSSHLACQFNSTRANLPTGQKYHSLLSFWMGTNNFQRQHVDQLSNNNKQTQIQNVHISAEFGGRVRMGSSVKTIKERFVLIRNRSPGSVKENRWRRLVHYTDKVSSPSPSPTCPSDNLHASKYSFTKFLGNHL